MNRRDRNRTDKERRIREAARKLFTEKGYEKTTLREIAAGAECGLGTVYTFVESKVDLLDLISKDDLARVSEHAFANLKGTTLRDQFLDFYHAIFAHHAENVDLARVIFRELGMGMDRSAEERRARFGALLERQVLLIEAAKVRGEVRREVNSVELATMVFGLHYFCLTLWFGGATDQHAAFQGLVRQLELLERGWR